MEKDDNTIKELEKFRVDCMYGKKKHYNARDRYANYHRNLGIIIVILSAVMGTSIYAALANSHFLAAQVVVGVFTVAIAVLTALQTWFNFEKRALSHKATADKYLWLKKEAQRMLAYHRDGAKPMQQLQLDIERMAQAAQEIQKEALETSPGDYEKAKVGIEKGEEKYTEDEKEI